MRGPRWAQLGRSRWRRGNFGPGQHFPPRQFFATTHETHPLAPHQTGAMPSPAISGCSNSKCVRFGRRPVACFVARAKGSAPTARALQRSRPRHPAPRPPPDRHVPAAGPPRLGAVPVRPPRRKGAAAAPLQVPAGAVPRGARGERLAQQRLWGVRACVRAREFSELLRAAEPRTPGRSRCVHERVARAAAATHNPPPQHHTRSPTPPTTPTAAENAVPPRRRMPLHPQPVSGRALCARAARLPARAQCVRAHARLELPPSRAPL